MIFVVLNNGKLVAAPRERGAAHTSHAVLANGGPVLAAGEFTVEFRGSEIMVSALNDMSGHYQPGADGLAVAQDAFEAAGISVRPEATTSYDWRSS